MSFNKFFLIIFLFFLPISFAYEINYYHNDHLGSPAVITNQNRERVYSIDYKPFGEDFNEQGDNRLTYNSKEKDDTGLHYYGARYYDSNLGRFITTDPLGGSNVYVYTRNNPLKYVDPSGEEEKPVAVLFYTSKPEDINTFKQEVRQYMSNYKDRFEFRTFAVYGREDVESAIVEVNKMIKEGREVVRVNYFDHAGDVMFGLSAEEWASLMSIEKQEDVERCTIMGTCGGGNLERQTFKEMFRVSGSDLYVGVLSGFFGVTRYAVKNDLHGLLIAELEFKHLTLAEIDDVIKSLPAGVTQSEVEQAITTGVYYYHICEGSNPVTCYYVYKDEDVSYQVDIERMYVRQAKPGEIVETYIDGIKLGPS